MRLTRFTLGMVTAATTAGLVLSGSTTAFAGDSVGLAPTVSSKVDSSLPANAKVDPAHPADITSLRIQLGVVDGDHEYLDARASIATDPTFTAGSSWYLDTADVYRGSKKLAHIDPTISTNYNNPGFIEVQSRWGRGKFTVRNVVMKAYTDVSPYSFTYADDVVGKFTLKSGIRGGLRFDNIFSITGGTHHVVKVGVKRFLPKNKWKGYRTTIKLQAKKGKWRTVKKFKTNRKGFAKVRYSSRRNFKYRIKIAGNRTTIGGRSEASSKV